MQRLLHEGARVFFSEVWDFYPLIATIIVNMSGVVFCEHMDIHCLRSAGYDHLITQKRLQIVKQGEISNFSPYDVVFLKESNLNKFDKSFIADNGMIYDLKQEKTLFSNIKATTSEIKARIFEPQPNMRTRCDLGSSLSLNSVASSVVSNTSKYKRLLTFEDFGSRIEDPCEMHSKGIKSLISTIRDLSPAAIKILNKIDFCKFLSNPVYSSKSVAMNIVARINKLCKTVKEEDELDLRDLHAGPIIAAAILVGSRGRVKCRHDLLPAIANTGYGHFIDTKRIVSGQELLLNVDKKCTIQEESAICNKPVICESSLTPEFEKPRFTSTITIKSKSLFVADYHQLPSQNTELPSPDIKIPPEQEPKTGKPKDDQCVLA